MNNDGITVVYHAGTYNGKRESYAPQKSGDIVGMSMPS